MRLMMCAVVGLAAAGPVVGQSAATGETREGQRWVQSRQQGAGGVTIFQPTAGGSAGGGNFVGVAPDSAEFAWVMRMAQSAAGDQTGPDAVPVAEFVRATRMAQSAAGDQSGPIAVSRVLESYTQQQRETRALEIDGKPVSMWKTGASLQVYLGDEPYPESRMKTEGNRTVLLDSDGKPAGEMVVTGQRVELRPIQGEQPKGRLLIGVSLSPVDSTLANHLGIAEDKASMISSVTEGWPAAEAGLESGDVIVAVEGRDEGTSEALRAVIAERDAGDSLRVKVISGGEKKDVTITLSDEARASSFLTTGGVAGVQLVEPGAFQNLYRLQSGPSETDGIEAVLRASEDAAAATQRARGLTGRVEALRVMPSQGDSDYRFAANEAARVTVDIPAGGGRAVVRSSGEGDISRRLGALEERMARIEKMLEKLTEQGGSR